MADLSITAANVAAGTGARVEHGYAGEAITEGQALYKDASDGYRLKKASNSTLAQSQVVGIALNSPAAAGQPVAYQSEGTIAIGATGVSGVIYMVSATAGGIAPAADTSTDEYTAVIGIGAGAGNIKLGLLAGNAKTAGA